MLEKAVESAFARRVKALGGSSFKFSPVVAGNPDRIVLMPGGWVGFVELKADGGVLSPVQRLWHARAAELGVVVEVVTGPLEARNWVPPMVGEPGAQLLQ